MHHIIKKVATNRFFDPDEFSRFAWENREKYSVCGSKEEHATVSSFNVDDLAKAFRLSLGDDFEAHRQRQIEAQTSGQVPRM